MSIKGNASATGTESYQHGFPDRASRHFRESTGLVFSSLGLGTYLGEATGPTDLLYREAIVQALGLGCNVIDSAINYRNQQSERAIGKALTEAIEKKIVARDQVIVATKGGYVPFDKDAPRDPHNYVRETYIETGIASEEEIIEWNCITPRYIEDQLGRSLRNLNLDCIDIYYLHNPEAQFETRGAGDFYRTVTETFQMLEGKIAEGQIGMYGLATWDGFRVEPTDYNYLSLAKVVEAAEAAGGKDHHFKVVQLPYNLAMVEACMFPNQEIERREVSFLEAARYFGITVMTSVPTLQGRLSRGLPEKIQKAFPNLKTDAQRAIQFVRSTPGITTALVGMKQAAHVEENLALAEVPPLSAEEFQQAFQV